MFRETDPLLPRHSQSDSRALDPKIQIRSWKKKTSSIILSIATVFLTGRKIVDIGQWPVIPPSAIHVAIIGLTPRNIRSFRYVAHIFDYLGAGPAGVFAASRLHELTARLNRPVEITIFERKSSIGGRLVPDIPTYPFNDSRELPLSAEASSYTSPIVDLTSIVPDYKRTWWPFSSLRKNVERSLYVYNKPVELTRPSSASPFRSRTWEWWCFGYSVNGAKRIGSQFRGKLQNIRHLGMQDSVTTIVDSLGLSEPRSQVSAAIFAHHGVGKTYINRIIKSESRVQFGQEADSMNSLTLGMMAYAADEGKSQTGGHLVSELHSVLPRGQNIHLRLSTEVFGLRKLNSTKWILASRHSETSEDQTASLFDAIILAAPMDSLQLDVRDAQLPTPRESIDFLSRHVTWFTSAKSLDCGQVGQKELKNPTRIITRLPPSWKTPSYNSGAIEILDMGFHVRHTPGGDLKERLYRVVSDMHVTSANIRDLLGGTESSWIARHEMKQGYPAFGPRTSFSPFELDDAVWHSSVVEELHSSVGMSAWAGKNVADLVYQRIKRW